MSKLNEDTIHEKYFNKEKSYILEDDLDYSLVFSEKKNPVNETIKNYKIDLENKRQRYKKRKVKEMVDKNPESKQVIIFEIIIFLIAEDF